MTWVLVGLQVLACWWIWDVRRAMGLRARPTLPHRSVETKARPDFKGAIPPNRYVVVQWPSGNHVYRGCIGAEARKIYEHTHPAVGEEVEFWELGNRRGHKVG